MSSRNCAVFRTKTSNTCAFVYNVFRQVFCLRCGPKYNVSYSFNFSLKIESYVYELNFLDKGKRG